MSIAAVDIASDRPKRKSRRSTVAMRGKAPRTWVVKYGRDRYTFTPNGRFTKNPQGFYTLHYGREQ